MPHDVVQNIFLWLMFVTSLLYMLEMPWRVWRGRMPRRWGPIYAEFFVPALVLMMAATNRDALLVRALTFLFCCTGTLLRVRTRSRFGIPAWPPV